MLAETFESGCPRPSGHAGGDVGIWVRTILRACRRRRLNLGAHDPAGMPAETSESECSRSCRNLCAHDDLESLGTLLKSEYPRSSGEAGETLEILMPTIIQRVE